MQGSEVGGNAQCVSGRSWSFPGAPRTTDVLSQSLGETGDSRRDLGPVGPNAAEALNAGRPEQTRGRHGLERHGPRAACFLGGIQNREDLEGGAGDTQVWCLVHRDVPMPVS